MKKTTNSIKKNFIVLLSTLGCLLIADTLFAGEPGEQAPENIDNRYDAPTTAATTSAPAEKSRGVRIVFGSDLVSSYIWRGFYNAGASIQPTLGMKAGGFALTAWGSVDFASSSYKEADLT